MCLLQKHGGPDDEGIYISEKHHLVFGHRRLSLIDLSAAGHQPMSYADERYYITYNGELYNYIELKDELLNAGCYFNTNSDTEVILAAFSVWGPQAFSKFSGMFAFALFDRETENVYLVRDPSGIKPMYFAVTEEGLAFASEVRALSSLAWLQEQDKNWPVYFLAYGHLPEPITTLKQVKPLAKGCFIKYHIPSAKWDIEVFYYFSYIEKFGDRNEVLALVKQNLRASVKRHLISDAPIGVFLSGGLDSSIMALLAKQEHQADLKTLSIYFNEARYSEQPFQQLMVQKLQCDHHEYLLTESDFHTNLPGIFSAMDLPSCDGINTWFISKAAKDGGLKAVLSGIGGDELFGGYPSFNRIKSANNLAKLPAAVLSAGKYASSKKIRRLAYLSIKGPVGMYLFLRGQFTPRKIAFQLGIEEKEAWRILSEEPLLNNIGYQTNKNQASWIELNMYMQNQLLRDSDIMSMAHGIEIRVPFLDNSFVKLALGIETKVKYAGTNGKQLLIDAFRDQLPQGIWDRPKMGFSFPFAEWLSKNEMAREVFMAGDKKAVSNYQDFVNGKLHWSQFMSLMLLNNPIREK
jgi:asparagine synthase (glutamine-hydrolysing)